MAYSIGYKVHTWELSALGSWVVTFLTFTALYTGSDRGIFTTAIIATCLGLVGTVTSVAGNEIARKLCRGRYIICVVTVLIGLAFEIEFSSGGSYGLAAALCLVYAGLIWAVSSSLTMRTVGGAKPERRGGTMAVYSMLGYIGVFLGPLALGATLDLAGGIIRTPGGWRSCI